MVLQGRGEGPLCCLPRAHPSWLWEGATPPQPMTPGSGACLFRSWELVVARASCLEGRRPLQ